MPLLARQLLIFGFRRGTPFCPAYRGCLWRLLRAGPRYPTRFPFPNRTRCHRHRHGYRCADGSGCTHQDTGSRL